MRKITTTILCIILPILVNAQHIEGISFSKASNWQELLNEARKANKPILVDAFATWCGPCKKMDKEVYPDKSVADYVNTNFISAKIQMDSTVKDNSYIKGWYHDAHKLSSYVNAYPSFLFFTPDGKFFDKKEGFYEADNFIAMLKNTISTKSDFLARLELFKQGKLKRDQLVQLAILSKELKDDSTALEIVKAYKRQYIDNASLDSILNPEVNEILSRFVEIFSFDDQIIDYMYHFPNEANSKFDKWDKYSGNITDWIITRDYIDSKVSVNGQPVVDDPDWKLIMKQVSKRFGKGTAERLILNAQIQREHQLKRWDEATALELKKLNKYGIDTSGIGRISINNLMYRVVFKNVSDTNLLKSAAKVMKKVIDLDNHESPERLDTYASLLYKAGEKSKALTIESQALDLSRKMNHEENIKFYSEMIDRMKKDFPIWKQ